MYATIYTCVINSNLSTKQINTSISVLFALHIAHKKDITFLGCLQGFQIRNAI